MLRVAAAVAFAFVVLTGCTTDPADTTESVIPPPLPGSSTVTTAAPTTSTVKTTAAVESAPNTDASTTTTAASTTTIAEPPRLAIADPGHGQTITTETYVFRGMTDPGNSVAVGGRYMATVQDDGTWTLSLQLGPGRNSTTFVATDPDTGLETEAVIRVYYIEPPQLEGKTLRVYWLGNGQREYYYDEQPTGYFSGSRLPVRWSADGNVDRQLAMASRDESTPLQAFNTPFDGLVMLLEPTGNDAYLVLDEQPVVFAKGAAVLTAACPANDAPHVVTLGLTRDGLDPTQAWALDPDAGTLTEVDADALDCPGFEARPVGGDGVGAITSQLRCGYGAECDRRIYDISTGQLMPMDYWSHGGSMLDTDQFDRELAFSQVSVMPSEHTDPGAGRVWLKEAIARDWTGRPLWRVLDATPELNLYAHYDCWVIDDDDHPPAVAELDHTDDHRLVRAWAVSTDGSQFVEVDPNSVQCQGEEGD